MNEEFPATQPSIDIGSLWATTFPAAATACVPKDTHPDVKAPQIAPKRNIKPYFIQSFKLIYLRLNIYTSF